MQLRSFGRDHRTIVDLATPWVQQLENDTGLPADQQWDLAAESAEMSAVRPTAS